MRNKKLSTKTTVTIATLALIVAGTGTLGLTMTNAGQKTVKTEVGNQEVAQLYKEESDSTAKIAVKEAKKNTAPEKDSEKAGEQKNNSLVVEVPYGAEVDADGNYNFRFNDDGTIRMSVEEQADENDEDNPKKKIEREEKVNYADGEMTDKDVEEETTKK